MILIRKATMNRKLWMPLIVLVLIVVSGYTIYDLNGHSFDPSDRQILLIVTDSMDGDVHEYEIDSFPKNTLIAIQKMDSSKLIETVQIGDVIQFNQGGYLNHHRVKSIHLDDGYIETQGDNAPLPESVPLDRIYGKVVGTNHILGETMAFVQGHLYLVLFIMFVITASDYVYRLWKDEKQKQKEIQDGKNDHDN